jgi:hypothetical protein
MMITDLVAPEAILPALKVNSKKQALQELAARAASLTGQNERAIFEVLLQREKLGTTAVGYGVAIPHGKLPKLEKLFGCWPRKAPAPITSRRWRGLRGCCGIRTLPRNCAPRATPKRSIRCSRCRRQPRRRRGTRRSAAS